MISITPDWAPITQDEVDGLAPYTLSAQGLSDDQVTHLKETYRTSLLRAAVLVSNELGRVPTQQEAEQVAKALVSYFNETFIPTLREREGSAQH